MGKAWLGEVSQHAFCAWEQPNYVHHKSGLPPNKLLQETYYVLTPFVAAKTAPAQRAAEVWLWAAS